ncbi:TPA: type II secretion system inner membrane protein GspF [Serratia fonticola]
MAKFSYRACDSVGKICKGTLEAESVRRARQQLREKKLTVLDIVPTRPGLLVRLQASDKRLRLSSSDLALVTRQLATLIAAALPLEEVLFAVARQSEKKSVATLLMQIRSRVLEGFPLAQTLSQYPAVFDRLFCAMVAAGETTGQLPLILTQLADHVEQRQQINNKMTQAMTYPAILTLVAIAVVSLLLTAVVPKVIEQFMHMKQALPVTTRILIGCSDFLRQWGLALLLTMVIALLGCRQLLKKPHLRLAWDQRLLKMPVLGPLFLTLNTARYAHTLSILNASAVPLIDSMKISASVLANEYAREQLLNAMARVREGESLSQTLENTALFSPMMRHMIASGERSGELDTMLKRAADMQQDALNQRITLALSLFEPLLVVSMASVVLFIILAILQPILQLNSLIG